MDDTELLSEVLKESFKIYCAINDGVINLVDKFFEMPRHEAFKALEIYKRAGQQKIMLGLCFLEDLVYAWWYHGFVGAFSIASQGVALGVCLMLATGSGMLVVGPCLTEERLLFEFHPAQQFSFNLPWLWFLKGISPVAILKNAAQVTRYSDQNQQQSSKIQQDM
ncbi:uncharacterized protein LOC131231996 isoform X2 [Magnolia sinica]|uniref:uncharacterized protein LOC131231996 isoform X2 n=1 Tax=Magnolia sinica TaxID=86752 RepID=UPI002658498F|nr:uncharacterized protein LOC131231996 isoform X2 [Magnolia sinica]